MTFGCGSDSRELKNEDCLGSSLEKGEQIHLVYWKEYVLSRKEDMSGAVPRCRRVD